MRSPLWSLGGGHASVGEEEPRHRRRQSISRGQDREIIVDGYETPVEHPVRGGR